ncbi:c-type cytochrome [Moritella sp. 24]|uniref:c-type cytochrome n=1 Tax=Moritella sp. 24 TaxID=2746230 RepID=UPI001BAD81AB|nr:c-type cytochrome [Moritella sp. 24]QUM76978.1 c-type cytochrome [Moritella sp. 24]
MVIAVVILLLVISSLLFHFLSPWWFTPIASNWTAIDQTINITFWVTGTVFVAVNLFLVYVVYRFRYNKNRKADYDPENSKLEAWLTVLTSIGIFAMLTPGLFVWADFVNPPSDANEVEVVGQQWHWSFRLPGADGKLGRTAISLINVNNPFGIDQNDPDGQDDILINSNELHLPIERPVKVLLRSKDVLHNFTVPQFRVKMDLVPGTQSYLWFTPTLLGRFEILCLELCGIAHYTMRGYVVVESESDYQAWLNEQPTFRQSLARIRHDISAGQRIYSACIACHGVNGEGSEAIGAPMLAGQEFDYLNRQLHYFRDNIRGTHHDDIYGRQMLPFAAMLADDDAVKNVSRYLHSLPSIAQTVTQRTRTQGNASTGQSIYKNCAVCHGEFAEGNYAQKAPQLARQYSWYLKRQLEYYQQGIRGKHPQDMYGSQMILMSKLLQNERAIDDVLAYIATLQPAK